MYITPQGYWILTKIQSWLGNNSVEKELFVRQFLAASYLMDEVFFRATTYFIKRKSSYNKQHI
jgi:hypothetical protein